MISALIVNWNTREYLRACLLSLRAASQAASDLDLEVIVVDNASTDGSAAMMRAEFPEVRLMANSRNDGYAAGNNQALAAARGEFLWLLNPDTEVPAGTAELMLRFLLTRERRGAVASALIDARTGRPQRSVRTFPTPGALWAEATGLASRYPRSRRFGSYRMGWWRMEDARPVEQPMASSLLLRRSAVQAAGGLFDEQFPIFFNDVDLCWRLRAAGWQIWFLPEARVLHHGGASTRQVRPEMISASHLALLRFYHKHFRATVPPPIYVLTVAMVKLSGVWRRWRAEQTA